MIVTYFNFATLQIYFCPLCTLTYCEIARFMARSVLYNCSLINESKIFFFADLLNGQRCG